MLAVISQNKEGGEKEKRGGGRVAAVSLIQTDVFVCDPAMTWSIWGQQRQNREEEGGNNNNTDFYWQGSADKKQSLSADWSDRLILFSVKKKIFLVCFLKLSEVILWMKQPQSDAVPAASSWTLSLGLCSTDDSSHSRCGRKSVRKYWLLWSWIIFKINYGQIYSSLFFTYRFS